MTRRDIPNIISIIRIILVIPVVYLIGHQNYPAALILFAIAGVSDGIDGWLARHFDWRSELGAMLDPLADKLLLVSSFLMAGWEGLVSLWLLLAVILRDLVIVTGAILYHHWCESFRGEPLLVGKACTVVQLLLIVSVLVNAGVSPLPEPLMQGLVVSCFAITLLSGISYVFVWGSRAWYHHLNGTGRRRSN